MAIRWGARGATALAGVLAAAVVVGVAPAAASVFPGSSSIDAFLRAGNGYHVTVSAADGKYVIGASKGGASSAYTGSGHLTPEGFEADFGRFGSVSVAFQPSGKSDEVPFPGCVGGPTVFTKGTLVGTIRFEGEHGYTTLDATSAEAIRVVTPELKCKQDLKPPRHRHVQKGPTAPGLSVSCEGLRFGALRTRPARVSRPTVPRQPPVSFVAELSERAGPIGISRLAIASGHDGSLLFGTDLKTAIVRPPAPFSGVARWASSPERWSGSLRVAFPGKTVRLTGGRLRAALVAVHLEEGGYGYGFRSTCAGGR